MIESVEVDAMGKRDILTAGSDISNVKVRPWDGICHDPSLPMFREAVRYAEARGLTPDFMPELRPENGILHAFRQNGEKLRLEHGKEWEYKSGYAALVEELANMMQHNPRDRSTRGQ